MAEQAKNLNLPIELWKAAELEAEKIAPRPKTSTAVAGFGGLFGGFMATYALLGVSELAGLAGLNADEPTFEGPALLAGIACGAIGYFFIRSKEKTHSAAFGRILETYEDRWREELNRPK